MVDITVNEVKQNIIKFQDDLKTLFDTFEKTNNVRIIGCEIQRDSYSCIGYEHDTIININLETTL